MMMNPMMSQMMGQMAGMRPGMVPQMQMRPMMQPMMRPMMGAPMMMRPRDFSNTYKNWLNKTDQETCQISVYGHSGARSQASKK